MHICFITNEYPKEGFPHGGVGTFVKTIATEMVKFNIKVTIIGINYTNEYEKIDENGIKIYRLKPSSNKGLKWFFNNDNICKKIKKINLQNPIDIIETSELGLAFIKKIPTIKYLIRLHGGHHFFAKAENRPTEWRKVWQEKKSFSKADYLVAVSNYVAQTTNDLLKLNQEKILVIYNPIDTKRFYQCITDKIESNTIFFAGTLVEKKGIRQLIESLEYLVDEFPDIKLKIAGRVGNIPGTQTSYKPILEKSISEKIKNNIEFLGTISNNEMPKHIEKAAICCYPSHMEAMPLAWLEVLSMGKMFIGSKTGPGSEAVIDDKTGLLVNPFDPNDIAEKIKYALLNPEKSLQMGRNAREMIINNFDICKIVLQNIDFYKSLLRN